MVKRASFIAGLLLAAFVSYALAANERRVTAREAEAIAIALRIPTLRVGGAIEVRPLGSTVHVERSAA